MCQSARLGARLQIGDEVLGLLDRLTPPFAGVSHGDDGPDTGPGGKSRYPHQGELPVAGAPMGFEAFFCSLLR